MKDTRTRRDRLEGAARPCVRRDISAGAKDETRQPAVDMNKRPRPSRPARSRVGSIRMGPHVILFLAANPRDSNLLRLTEECADIQRELRMTHNRDDFRFESRWAVSIDDLMRYLTELDPTVIHFSGHGCGDTGLMLQDAQGQSQLVSARALSMMLDATTRNVRVVVLNACYTAVQASALNTSVECVVSMTGAIGDDAARAFAIRFYSAIGNGRSVGNAVLHGIATLAAKQLPDVQVPRCLTRRGVDADNVVL